MTTSLLGLIDPRGLQNGAARSGRDFFRSMVINPNEVRPPVFAIVSNRTFLLDEREAALLEQPDQFAEFQASLRIVLARPCRIVANLPRSDKPAAGLFKRPTDWAFAAQR